MSVPKTIGSLRAASALAFSSIVGFSLAIAADEVHAQGTFLPPGWRLPLPPPQARLMKR
jgi:hypothetical protein